MIRHTLLVADREVRERWFVFIAAAVTAFLPYMTFVLPGGKNITRADMATVGIIIAMIFAVALSLIVGGSIVGRELAEKRLSFYFTRPLPAAAIWFGKLLAAFVLVVISFSIIAVPAVLVGLQMPTATTADWMGVVAWFTLLLACILFGHVTSTMVRSRSPRVIADLALLAGAITIGWLVVRPLVAGLAIQTAGWLVVAMLTLIVIAAFFGGAWQLSRGRSDARRSHAALQSFLWPAIGVVLVVGAGFTAWIFAARPSDLIYPDIGQISSRWFYMSGKVRGRLDYRPLFLVNGETGDSKRVLAVAGWSDVSRDGSTIAFVTTTSLRRQGPFSLKTMSLADGRLIDPGIAASPRQRKVLSDDGRRIAVIDNGILSVHDLQTRSIVASARLPHPATPNALYRMLFPSSSTVRIYEVPPRFDQSRLATIRALELDLVARRITITGEITREAQGFYLVANDDASRVHIVNWNKNSEAADGSIVDGRTLAPVADLGLKLRPYWTTLFLSDGRIAALEHTGDSRSITLFTAEGVRLSSHAVPATYLVGEGTGGMLVAGFSRQLPEGHSTHTTVVIDPATGKVVRAEENLYAVRDEFGWAADPRQPSVASDKVWLLRDRTTIYRWDPTTGSKKPLIRTATPDSES
jgi:hypothetical protein